MLNIHICLKFGTISKMPLPGQHKCPQLGSCNMQVLNSSKLFFQQTEHKLHILPFNDAMNNKMNTCILQCTFMSISGRRPGDRTALFVDQLTGLVERSYTR